MTRENGKEESPVQTGRKLVVLNLDSGVTVYVTPVSPVLIRAIVNRSETLYPYPEEAPYRLPLENAAIPGDTLPASQNPVYQELCKTVDQKRNRYQNDAIVLASVKNVEGSREELLARFADEIATLRTIAELPEDPWEAFVLGILVTSKRDFTEIVAVATETLPLTLDEVRDGFRYFRPDVSRATYRMVDRKQGARGAKEKHDV